MKKSTLLSTSLATLVLAAAPAFAETGARQDDSNVLVWAFLGACALIIFLQLVPVISMAFGLIKGAAGRPEEEAELEVVSSKYQ